MSDRLDPGMAGAQPARLVDVSGNPESSIDTGRVLRLAIRIAAKMLASGAQTEDVEAAIDSVTRGLGVQGVQAAVSFSSITVSHYAPGEPPTTLLRLVRDREADFTRLAELSILTGMIGRGEVDLAGAEARLATVTTASPQYGAVLMSVAAGVSAAGATLMFGGGPLDALATLGIALVVQPALGLLDRSGLPQFFRLAFGAAGSALAVALLVGIGLPINGGLVLTGSLLRFLPGYALVSGFRDLIDQSIVSGTARLAEALLLGAAVAGGTALGLTVAGSAGVELSIVAAGATDWGLVTTALAAALAVGGFAVRLGVPPRAVGQAAIIGATGWVIYDAATPPSGPIEPAIATLAATILIGIVGRVLASRTDTPAALWVVPAILPLLPGLQIVTAMLAPSDLARVSGLIGAAVTAFLIGTGVATGDIAVIAVRRLRDRVVTPAVGALAEGVDILVVGPVERVAGRIRNDDSQPGREETPAHGPTAGE